MEVLWSYGGLIYSLPGGNVSRQPHTAYVCRNRPDLLSHGVDEFPTEAGPTVVRVNINSVVVSIATALPQGDCSETFMEGVSSVSASVIQRHFTAVICNHGSGVKGIKHFTTCRSRSSHVQVHCLSERSQNSDSELHAAYGRHECFGVLFLSQ